MVNPKRAITRIEGEQFTHRELWRVVERQIESATKKRAGWFYDNLVAMVFAFLSLEAYLNFAGARFDAAYWKGERTHFAKTGVRGKVTKVLTMVGLQLKPDKRPLTTVWELNALRDQIAHGKTIPIRTTLRHVAGTPPPLNSSPLAKLVTDKKAADAVADVLKLAEEIHCAGKVAMSHDPWWGDHPFGGITMHVGGGTVFDDGDKQGR